VVRSAKLLNVTADDAGARVIASRARGTPRVANRLLRRVRDFAQVRAHGVIDERIALDALAMLEVDHLGLDLVDRRILRTIVEKYDGGPVGLETVAVSVSEDPETVEDVYEPFPDAARVSGANPARARRHQAGLRAPGPGEGRKPRKSRKRPTPIVLTASRPRAAQIAVLVVTAFCASFSLFLFSATLPIYLYRDRGFSLEAVGELVGLAFVVQVGMTLLAGPLIDRRGARLAIRLGPACYVVAAVLFITTATPLTIGLARAMQGIGAAMIIPAAFAVLPSLVSERRRGAALGAFGATSTIALAIGPPVGLLLLRRGSALLFGTALAVAALAFASQLDP